MEIIIAPAYKLSTGLIIHVPAPWGHGNVIHAYAKYCALKGLKMTGIGSEKEDESGFLTNFGRFVDREEGLQIALKAKQIVKKHFPKDGLLSEDLWCEMRQDLYEQKLEIEKVEGKSEEGDFFQFWRNRNV